MKEIILATIILMATPVANAKDKLIIIPENYEEMTYSEKWHYTNIEPHQLPDETYSEAWHRQEYGVEDAQMKGYLLDIDK